jgi:hypothetical protein
LTCGGGRPWAQVVTQTFDPTFDPDNPWAEIFYNLYGGDGENPVSATWELAEGGDGTLCGSAILLVKGCNGIGYPQATVKIYDSQGGMLLATCTTDDGGTIYSSCIPNFQYGTYWVEVSVDSDRFGDFEGSVTFSCFGPAIITLEVADGYVCIPPCAGGGSTNCLLPLSKSLTATDSVIGSTPITYQEGISPPTWFGQGSYSYGGSPPFGGGHGCPGGDVTIQWYFLPSTCQLTLLWASGAFDGVQCTCEFCPVPGQGIGDNPKDDCPNFWTMGLGFGGFSYCACGVQPMNGGGSLDGCGPDLMWESSIYTSEGGYPTFCSSLPLQLLYGVSPLTSEGVFLASQMVTES